MVVDLSDCLDDRAILGQQRQIRAVHNRHPPIRSGGENHRDDQQHPDGDPGAGCDQAAQFAENVTHAEQQDKRVASSRNQFLWIRTG